MHIHCRTVREAREDADIVSTVSIAVCPLCVVNVSEMSAPLYCLLTTLYTVVYTDSDDTLETRKPRKA